jgi:hypothetical protein
MNRQECIDVCNSLLRGELSAVETYKQALEKFTDQAEASVLRALHDTHLAHTDKLREHVLSMNGAPSPQSGVWGDFAKAVEGTAKLLGESAALQALIAGERHGINEYEDALNNPDVMPTIQQLIRTDLLPDLQRNVGSLESLKQTV